jgi:hypothetical protein
MIGNALIAQQQAEVKRQDSYLAPPQDDAGSEHCEYCPYPLDEASALSGAARLRFEMHMMFEDPASSVFAKYLGSSVLFMIVVSTVALCLETVPQIEDSEVWIVIEAIVSIFFALEYFGRLICSRNRLRWLFEPLNVIDLLAFLPYFLQLATAASGVEALRVLRVVRLLRIFRLLKLSRQSVYMQIMIRSLSQSADAFGLLLFFLSLAIVVFSSLLYYAEKDSGPRGTNPNPFTSIPASFYWCVVTMATVGYGDNVPITPLGKFIAGITMICGILCIALPVSILGQNFQEVYTSFSGRAAPVLPAHVHRRTLLNQQLSRVRRNREELAKAMTQLRLILEDRSDVVSIANIWQTIDQVVVGGLVRLEDFLSKIDLPEERGDAGHKRHASSGAVEGGRPVEAVSEARGNGLAVS